MKSKIILFLKGIAMGTVDIVPGVSGSTVAVLLGFYERFIAALKNINLDLFRAVGGMFCNKFSAQSRARCLTACRTADLPWLINLLSGLGTAFVLASFFIPALMERYPSVMWGLFFGLVLGSIITPLRQVSRYRLRQIAIIALFAAGCFYLMGQHMQAPVSIETISADGTRTLSDICAQAPCFYTPNDVYDMPENKPLQSLVSGAGDIIAPGASVAVPRAYFSYCLLAGFCGICAMLLPGISGSFILLVMGCYYFMLHAGKSFLRGLSQGVFYPTHLLYILCFGIGAIAGIALFSRALTYLLKNCRDATLCAIIGILIGCLRAIWPFKTFEGGIQVNIMPSSAAEIVPVAVACLSGLLIVVATIAAQDYFEKKIALRSPANR